MNIKFNLKNIKVYMCFDVNFLVLFQKVSIRKIYIYRR